MSGAFQPGDRIVQFPPVYSLPNLTPGKAYEVIEYDPNNTGWPEGCSGSPFVTIIDDNDKQIEALAHRFRKQEDMHP